VPGESQRTGLRLRKLIKATKSEAPRIDQTMGNCTAPTEKVKSDGSVSTRANQTPTTAPMKPSAIEARQPAPL